MHYYRYIMSRSPEPDFVMITDLRDVVFQRDPFEDQIAELEVYLEDAAVKVGDEIFNTRWMRDLVGASGVSEMIGSPISCSGTVMGTRTAVLVYLVEMMTNIIWRRRPMGSRDQAVHNLLIHRGDLPAANVVRNGYGRVLTLGKMDAFETDAVGRVLNHDGSIPAVLHQWDRHSALATKLTVEGSLA